MIKKIFILLFIIFCAVSLFVTYFNHNSNNDTAVIRIGKSTVTLDEFNKAFEFAKTGYSHKNLKNTENYREIKYRVLEQMTEELIIMERGRELEVKVSDSEVDNTINQIKKDYPDDTFEKVFLNQAISYSKWKERLKRRLLIEKVTGIELEKRVSVTSEDIAKFYDKYKTHQVEPDIGHPLKPVAQEKKTKKDIQAVKKYLRGEKIREIYGDWIMELKEKYGIHINNIP
ncbi:putative Protein containing SurA [Candidatus Magnetomoraceae bacterium gMMP-1]